MQHRLVPMGWGRRKSLDLRAPEWRFYCGNGSAFSVRSAFVNSLLLPTGAGHRLVAAVPVSLIIKAAAVVSSGGRFAGTTSA